jgi:hypothetical protein
MFSPLSRIPRGHVDVIGIVLNGDVLAFQEIRVISPTDTLGKSADVKISEYLPCAFIG